MFERPRYKVFHWKRNNQFVGLVVLMPALTDGYEHADKVFREHGYRPKSETGTEIDLGIPKLMFRSPHSKREIEWFLSGLNKSPISTWDFSSIYPLEFDVKMLDHVLYEHYLKL